MRLSAAVFTTVTFALHAMSSPVSQAFEIRKSDDKPTGRRQIVRFQDAAAMSKVLNSLNTVARSRVAYEWKLIHGFVGNFDPATLDSLRSSPDVTFIEEDGVAHITAVNQTNAPWGLSRLSTPSRLVGNDSSLNFTYTYDDSAGRGVDIYVVDTGINTNHTQFGGRARWGATFGPYKDADGHGHGTHCSGTAAGSQFGVAKAASLIAVKVIDDSGSGDDSDIISGLDWVGREASASGRPSIVSMSLGGDPSQSLDDAVNALAKQGVHVIVAAGNENSDAGEFSPSRAAGAIAVGASDITDTRASFSNYGASVALWAPGVNVISAWIGSNNATRSASGTSMACPHVSGLVAYLIAIQGNVSPSAMRSKLQSLAAKDALSDIPAGTVNLLAQNIL